MRRAVLHNLVHISPTPCPHAVQTRVSRRRVRYGTTPARRTLHIETGYTDLLRDRTAVGSGQGRRDWWRVAGRGVVPGGPAPGPRGRGRRLGTRGAAAPRRA